MASCSATAITPLRRSSDLVDDLGVAVSRARGGDFSAPDRHQRSARVSRPSSRVASTCSSKPRPRARERVVRCWSRSRDGDLTKRSNSNSMARSASSSIHADSAVAQLGAPVSEIRRSSGSHHECLAGDHCGQRRGMAAAGPRSNSLPKPSAATRMPRDRRTILRITLRMPRRVARTS